MITKAMIGSASILSVQGVAAVPTDGALISEIIKIVIQIIVGSVTLIQMFKKPKEVISNQNKQ